MNKLTKKQALAYKQSWKQVELMQSRELRTLPVSLKFKQLCFLMDSFRSRSIDKEKEKQINITRRRWAALKSRWKNGC